MKLAKLVVLGPLVLGACYDPKVPAYVPPKNPLDDAPPAEVAKRPASDASEGAAQKKLPFDRAHASIVLARSARNAHSCVEVVPPGGPRGKTTVTVTFAGVGKSTKAVLPQPFEGTPIGKCAAQAFVGMIVAPFEGPDVDVEQPIDLAPTEAAAPSKAK